MDRFMIEPSDRPGFDWAIVSAATGDPVGFVDGPRSEAEGYALAFAESVRRLMRGEAPCWPS
jgi:hypothetical protein